VPDNPISTLSEAELIRCIKQAIIDLNRAASQLTQRGYTVKFDITESQVTHAHHSSIRIVVEEPSQVCHT
jgi:hypothetical protein